MAEADSFITPLRSRIWTEQKQTNHKWEVFCTFLCYKSNSRSQEYTFRNKKAGSLWWLLNWQFKWCDSNVHIEKDVSQYAKHNPNRANPWMRMQFPCFGSKDTQLEAQSCGLYKCLQNLQNPRAMYIGEPTLIHMQQCKTPFFLCPMAKSESVPSVYNDCCYFPA